jgi:hypothetical protein
VLLWSLDIDLGARGDTLVCCWRAKEIGLLWVLRCSYLAPGSLGRMPAGLGAGAYARSRSSEPLTLGQEEPEMV